MCRTIHEELLLFYALLSYVLYTLHITFCIVEFKTKRYYNECIKGSSSGALVCCVA